MSIAGPCMRVRGWAVWGESSCWLITLNHVQYIYGDLGHQWLERGITLVLEVQTMLKKRCPGTEDTRMDTVE